MFTESLTNNGSIRHNINICTILVWLFYFFICSLQIVTRPHFSEFVVWAVEHKDQWRGKLGRSISPEHLGLGHTKETGNRNATVISENCYQLELNTCYWMEQPKLSKRQRSSRKEWETQLPGNGACQSSHSCVATWFPSVSCSIMLFIDSFVSYDGAKCWRSCLFLCN
jgi:hypothetical protein